MLAFIFDCVVTNFLKLDRLSVRNRRVSAVLSVIRRYLDYSFRESTVMIVL